MPVSKVLNFVKPALGMSAMPPVQTRTTLVKFFNLDVDLKFFIFMILVLYKTQKVMYRFHNLYWVGVGSWQSSRAALTEMDKNSCSFIQHFSFFLFSSVGVVSINKLH